MKFIIDSRDRLQAGEHDFVSNNTSSDFVIRLPQSIDKFTLVEYDIPLTYYIFNSSTNKLIYRINGDVQYYLLTIPNGSYSSKSIQPILATALNTAVQLSNPLITTPLIGATVTFDKVFKKLVINNTTNSIQFIATGDPDAVQGIPFGDPNGFPSELIPNAPLDPLREQLSDCARLIGLTANSVTPNPFTEDDGFPLGVQYAFYDPILPIDPLLVTCPNIINLQGENYFFIKSDLAGLSQIRQGKVVEIDKNENDVITISNLTLDRGIVETVQIKQNPFTILHGNFMGPTTTTEPSTIILSETTDTINFRLTFRNNIGMSLNGNELSLTIEL